MPWDLVRDRERLLIEIDSVEPAERNALIDSVRAQVEDGVNEVNLVHDPTNVSEAGVVRALLQTSQLEGVQVRLTARESPERSTEARPESV